jgi:hypothetical protein
MERIKEADDVIANCFILGKQRGYEFKEYKSKGVYNLDDLVKFNENEIKVFMDNLNNDIEQEKKYPLIRRKYFIPATGAKSWEIFKFSSMLYQKYTEDETIKCPYLLDGLIYHPLNQDYNTNARESKFKEYKWKPPTKNSVDLFVVFEKNKETGKVQNVYDNSDDENIKNKLKSAIYGNSSILSVLESNVVKMIIKPDVKTFEYSYFLNEIDELKNKEMIILNRDGQTFVFLKFNDKFYIFDSHIRNIFSKNKTELIDYILEDNHDGFFYILWYKD